MFSRSISPSTKLSPALFALLFSYLLLHCHRFSPFFFFISVYSPCPCIALLSLIRHGFYFYLFFFTPRVCSYARRRHTKGNGAGAPLLFFPHIKPFVCDVLFNFVPWNGVTRFWEGKKKTKKKEQKGFKKIWTEWKERVWKEEGKIVRNGDRWPEGRKGRSGWKDGMMGEMEDGGGVKSGRRDLDEGSVRGRCGEGWCFSCPTPLNLPIPLFPPFSNGSRNLVTGTLFLGGRRLQLQHQPEQRKLIILV